MKIQFPASIFSHNKLKEIYYRSLLIKQSEWKFRPCFQESFPFFTSTAIEISLMNINWGASKKTLCRILGNPRYACKLSSRESNDILFFKQEIAGEKTIIQCHFLNDQFYYAHIDFLSSLANESQNVREMVKAKFEIGELLSNNNMIITDHASNKLIIEHNVYMHLDYLTGKPSLIKRIADQSLKKEQEEQRLLQLRRDATIRL